MDNYNKIADELEKLAEYDPDTTLDKIAAAALIYEYSGFDSDSIEISDRCLTKIASKTISEANVAAEIGIKAAINAMIKMEV